MKPEKRKLSKEPLAYLQYDKGYNHCFANYEAFLPDVREIESILNDDRYDQQAERAGCIDIELSNRNKAKAIAERIGK